jgi:predicted porin
MKALGAAALASLSLMGVAHAADLLPTTKPTLAPPENCFASLWTYLDSTAADCPLSYGPFTLYATLDAGLMYNTNGAPWSPAFVNGTQGLISKQSHGVRWLWSPNNVNQSVIGVKMSQPIANGWSLIGTLEAGFDPISGYLANSQRAQVMNNGKPLALQSASGDSSRAGQWDNSQFFLGLSNKTYGTLTAGRVNALSLDGLIAYDPMGSSYAFSPFGFTGMYAGFSDTELARSNTAIKYRGEFENFRVAGLAQVGGYNQGNGSTQMWQGQVGGDIHNLYGGTLSLDFVGSYAVDGVLTTNFTTPIPKFYSTNDLKASLSNNVGYLALAKYRWGPAQLFAGWEYFRQGNPTDDFPNGFKTIANYSVPGNILDNKAFPTVWITTNAFNIQRIYNTIWAGFKYAVNERLDVSGAFYYAWQNDFSTTPCTGQGIHISSSACAGTLDTFSLLVDYRPVKRIDVYAGVALSNVYAGLANGFQATQNIDPTVGVRVKF